MRSIPHPEIDGLTIHVVTDAVQALDILKGMGDHYADTGIMPALDFETTALVPEEGRIRLTCVCNSETDVYVIDHDYSIPFSAAVHRIVEAPWAVFNAKFEGRWIDAYHSPADGAVRLFDVGVMRKAKLGGGPLRLDQQIKFDLGEVISKDLQNSDWSKRELSDAQYVYGGSDAYYTFRLSEKWQEELSDEQWNGFRVLNDAWRGTTEMEDTGMLVDAEYHRKLIRMWALRRNAAEKAIRKWTPEDVIPNIRSKKQLSDFIKAQLEASGATAALRDWPATGKTEQLKLTRDVLRQMSFRSSYPFSRWLAALMVFNRADKYLGTYGEKLLTIQELSATGRVHARFNIAQAITGRYSSSGPNLQNIPRNPLVRRSFIAPEGLTMVLADYSGIELRVLAEMSGDEQLKHDVIFGDVHAESARQVFGAKTYDDLKEKHPKAAKELRSKAKAFSFQLTYGASPPALAVVLRCSDDEAAEAVEAWARRYPKAYHFRTLMMEKMNIDGLLPCASGRTIYVPKHERRIPVAANYPIQGSAADVMYRAVTRLNACGWEVTKKPWGEDMSMMASVHDELLLLTRPGRAARFWHRVLVDQMKRAWLDIFPGTSTHRLVESEIGDSWAAKP